MVSVNRSSRRTFLNAGAGAAVALGAAGSPASLARAASSPNRSVVCLYLIGGNDSNNMVVPIDEAAYSQYAAARGALAIAKSDLLPLSGVGESARYGFHPSLPGLQDLYNQNALAVLANVGRTIESGVPKDLFQHNSMQVRFFRDGYVGIPWATPAADSGGSYRALMLQHSVTLSSPEVDPIQHRTFAASIASRRQEFAMPQTRIGKRLGQVLAAMQSGSFRRKAFLVPMEGFDTHVQQMERQASLYRDMDDAVVAFYSALRQMGTADSVTLYTDSEFSRALAPNPVGGTEPGWGGHHFILGGSTLGGRIYGSFPSMRIGGADDAIGNGTWIPSTSNAQYAATLAAWYGADLRNVPEYAGTLDASRPRLDFLAG